MGEQRTLTDRPPVAVDTLVATVLTALDVDGGFTVDVKTGEIPTDGYAVGEFPELSAEYLASVDADDIADYVTRNGKVLAEPGNFLGGWLDTATGHTWIDVVHVENDRDAAIAHARAANQIAIFDLSTGTEIPTGGNGEWKA